MQDLKVVIEALHHKLRQLNSDNKQPTNTMTLQSLVNKASIHKNLYLSGTKGALVGNQF